MSTSTKFWNRIGNMLGFASRTNGHDGLTSIPADEHDVLTHRAVSLADAGGSSTDVLNAPRAGGMLRWASREPGVSKRDQQERLAGLMDAMREHFEKQDVRSEQLTAAVNRMAGILEQLPAVQRSQGECITSIATHLDTANRHASDLRETLARVPSSIQAQAEAIQSVSKQMELAGEQDAQMALSLQRLGSIVDSLSQAGSAQVEVLQQLRGETNEQRESLTTLVREQGRRFTVTLAIAGVMVVAALGAMAIAIWVATTR